MSTHNDAPEKKLPDDEREQQSHDTADEKQPEKSETGSEAPPEQ